MEESRVPRASDSRAHGGTFRWASTKRLNLKGDKRNTFNNLSLVFKDITTRTRYTYFESQRSSCKFSSADTFSSLCSNFIPVSPHSCSTYAGVGVLGLRWSGSVYRKCAWTSEATRREREREGKRFAWVTKCVAGVLSNATKVAFHHHSRLAWV